MRNEKKNKYKRGFWKKVRKEQTKMKSQKIEQENYFDIEKEKKETQCNLPFM